MVSEQDQPGRREPASESAPPAARTLEMVQSDDASEAGDRVCWAFLVCEECGAVTSEGHRPECSQAGQSPDH